MAEDIAVQPSQPGEPAQTGWTRARLLIILIGAVVLFCLTYVLAWWSAYRLSLSYLQDAQTSYQAGRYLDALVGYKAFDEASNRYKQHGGYMQVEHIWASAYAVPLPADIQQAQQKIDEIVNSRLTIDDAEQFVQENTGQSNPYLGMIYLRLGELYEANDRLSDAQGIYESIPSLFSDDAGLIEQARIDLANLKKKTPGS